MRMCLYSADDEDNLLWLLMRIGKLMKHSDFCTSWPFYFFMNDKEKIEEIKKIVYETLPYADVAIRKNECSGIIQYYQIV